MGVGWQCTFNQAKSEGGRGENPLHQFDVLSLSFLSSHFSTRTRMKYALLPVSALAAVTLASAESVPSFTVRRSLSSNLPRRIITHPASLSPSPPNPEEFSLSSSLRDGRRGGVPLRLPRRNSAARSVDQLSFSSTFRSPKVARSLPETGDHSWVL